MNTNPVRGDYRSRFEKGVMDMRQNCWTFMDCGRQPGGDNVGELGVCPAAQERYLDGAHGGRNAGRACWVVAGTFCGGEIQGEFAQKEKDCLKCEFYRYVKDEEDTDFESSVELIRKLRGVSLYLE